MSNLEKSATPTATHAMLAKFPKLVYQPLGRTNLWVSQAGFGGYRVGLDLPEQREALEAALVSGINLLDTSANYMAGESEKLYGQVLADLVRQRRISRDEVVIVSKAGYLQGETLATYKTGDIDIGPSDEVVQFSDDLYHCIHPQFLENQINQSLERLQIDTLDVFLLHNPEYFLLDALKKGNNSITEIDLFARVKAAFEFLESCVKKGKIQYYGISSNTFPSNPGEGGYWSLSKLLEYLSIPKKFPHFSVLQFPANLVETGFILSKRPEVSLIETCIQNGIGVLVNRPLNAIRDEKLIRLVTFKVDQERHLDQVTFEECIASLDKSERAFDQLCLNLIEDGPPEIEDIKNTLTLSPVLQKSWQSFQSYVHWTQVLENYLWPRIESGVCALAKLVGDDDWAKSWLQDHLECLNEALKVLSMIQKQENNRRVAGLIQQVNAADKDWQNAWQLSQKAIRALRSTEGITCVLVGMKKKQYVEDVVQELEAVVHICDRTASWKNLLT